MKKNWVITFVIGALSFGLMQGTSMAGQTINIKKLSNTPTVDGNAIDWQQIEATVIPLAPQTGSPDIGVNAVSVKAGVSGDSVYFLWQWKDSTEDKEHKPYIWNENDGKYDSSPQMEDRFTVNFKIDGDFTHDWLSGQNFQADMWHWKAARTNPIGLLHDKMTIITTEPTKKAYQTTAKNDKDIYIVRPSDEGDGLYSTKRYAVKEKDTMPKYILTDAPQGSIADVKAKGVWKDGTWTLECQRLLDTGHSDDAVFKAGDLVPAAIAVFNRSGDEKHNISDTIYFQF